MFKGILDAIIFAVFINAIVVFMAFIFVELTY